MQDSAIRDPNTEIPSQGFGTLKGVFIPSLLMIFGVIIFLRMGWIVGTCGIEWTLAIIGLSMLIVLITMLSMSAIATNISIGKGGVYYILARSLGLEAGSAAGLLLYLKDCMGTAFCAIGFAECAQDLLPEFSITLIALFALVALTIPACTSSVLALRLQMIILVSVILALFSFFSGDTASIAAPLPGVSTQDFSFWKVFAIFFPAMTGVESSIALSGTLKNPSRSLPFGSVGSILVGGLVYIVIALFLHGNVAREILISDPLIVQHIARFSALILFGIWGATLSSVLGGLLGGPHTLQALAEDGVVPRWIGKEYGKTNEPRIATLITFAITLVCILYGSVNAIAPVLTMISLICYALLNCSAAFEDIMGNPSFRPTFPVPWIVSSVGAFLSVFAMLMIDSGWAITTLVVLMGIFFLSKKRKLSSDWDDIREGIFRFFVLNVIYKLAYKTPSSKSWRPNFLVFTPHPTDHSGELLRFASAITQSKGLLTIASFVPNEMSKDELDAQSRKIHDTLKANKISSLVELGFATNITSGMKKVIANYGLGPLTPNTVVFGAVSQKEEIARYRNVIELVNAQNRNLIIINETEKPKIGDIDIWWDNSSSSNSELMIIFAYMLQKSKEWKDVHISVKCLVSSAEERVEKEQFFEDLFAKNRLKMEKNIVVCPVHSLQEQLAALKLLSPNAGLIFSSLRLAAENERDEEYANYLEQCIHKCADSPSMALVLASPTTNLKEVLSST